MGKNNHRKKNRRKAGSPHRSPRTGQAVRDSPLEDTGGTHSQLLLDHAGRSCNGAGRVMLHHLAELRQVPLHELQGFGRLWEDREGWQRQLSPPPFVAVPCASLYQTDTRKTQVPREAWAQKQCSLVPSPWPGIWQERAKNFLLLENRNWVSAQTLTSYVARS